MRRLWTMDEEVKIDKERLNTVMEQMCDDYCVWPTTCPTQERLEQHCNECPLNNITCDDFWEERGAE